MALFPECMLKCAQKSVDTADIVRDAMLQQQFLLDTANAPAFIDLPIVPP